MRELEASLQQFAEFLLKAEAPRPPSGSLEARLGRMDERILRIQDHKGPTVRKRVSHFRH
jgi:hypothetical protein